MITAAAIPWKRAGKLAAYVVPVLLVGGYILYLHLQISWLETDLSESENTVASLRASIDEQNASIEQWQSLAESRQEAAQRALQRAQEQTRRSERLVKEVRAMPAQTCGDGIKLIDKALGLGGRDDG